MEDLKTEFQLIPGNTQNPGNQEHILQKSMLTLTNEYDSRQKVEYFGSVKRLRLIISKDD